MPLPHIIYCRIPVSTLGITFEPVTEDVLHQADTKTLLMAYMFCNFLWHVRRGVWNAVSKVSHVSEPNIKKSRKKD